MLPHPPKYFVRILQQTNATNTRTMAHTRFSNDTARIAKQLQESTDVGRYMLNRPGWGATPHYVEDPYIRMTHWGGNVMRSPVDVASELDGRTSGLTKYGSVPPARPARKEPAAAGGPVAAAAWTHQSRATHPAWLYREVGTHRWDMPIHDPQRFSTFAATALRGAGAESRNAERDAFDRDPAAFYAARR